MPAESTSEVSEVFAAQPLVRRGFLWKVSFIAGLGGILYGYDMGIIAAALIFVRSSFALSTRWKKGSSASC